MKRILVSLFLSGMLLLPVYAQTSKGKSSKGQSSQQQTGAKLTAADRTFLKQAAEGNMAEVQMGQLGQQKGTSAEVKQLSQALATDHQQNQQMLQSLAQKEGVTLPTSVSAKDKAAVDRLSKLNGAAFDKAFAKQAMMEHRKDIASFKREESTTKNPDVKGYASETLPKLQQHLQLSETAAGQKAGASTAKQPAKTGS